MKMKIGLFLVLVMVSLMGCGGYQAQSDLDFRIHRITGESIHLQEAYEGKVVLLVNVASRCGLTKQYAGLQWLYEEYQGEGLEIVGFPCNDFRGQEPGSGQEIITFCQTNYGVTFDLMEKIQVKGEQAHPLYQFLTHEDTNAPFAGPIQWNFEKFLVDHHGQVIDRFAPKVKPGSREVVEAIELALANRNQADPSGFYMGREIADVMGYAGAAWLLRERREAEEATAEMVQALELTEGQVVCDFGCGNGYHTLMFAEQVGEQGAVYGVDMQAQMLQALRKRAEDAGVKNIEVIQASAHSSRLPDGAFDRVFMCDVYHELSDPVGVLAQVKRSLKAGGQLVLVEYKGEDNSVPIKPLHKMTRSQIDREMQANGFELARSYDALPWQHLLFYKVKSMPD